MSTPFVRRRRPLGRASAARKRAQTAPRPSPIKKHPSLARPPSKTNRESGDPKKARPYLPADKQFLVTRGVPCLRRAADLERAADAAGAGAGAGAAGFDPKREYALSGEDEGWTATHRDPAAGAATGAAGAAAGEEEQRAAAAAAAAAPGGEAAATAAAAPAAASASAAAKAAADDDGVPDMADLDIADDDDEAAVSARPAATAKGPSHNANTVAPARTYDLHVTYDQYYRVPRLWLVGFDGLGCPLAQDCVLEDVSEDHARKTITREAHPHGAAPTAASIHPCRHAEVMSRLAERAAAGGAAQALTVERYLVLFLKFIASVVPTIQYDYTMET